MSSLHNEQLAELTERVYTRIDEFGHEAVHLTKPSQGILRLIYDEIWEMLSTPDHGEFDQRYAEGFQQGLREGQERGEARWRGYADADEARKLSADDERLAEELGRSLAENFREMIYDDGDGSVELIATDGSVALRTAPVTVAPDTYPNGAPRPPLDAFDEAALDAERALSEDDPNPDDNPATLGDDWPTLPDVEGGIDRFSEHPVTGEEKADPEPAAVALAESAEEEEDDTAAEIAGLRMGTDAKAAELRTILIELQVMSHDGMTMPTMEEWDKKRPKGMSKAQAIIKRHGVTWRELAIRSRLKMKRAA